MTCALCGKQEQSAPGAETNWRLIDADGQHYYFCPREFPPDKGSTAEDFKKAYYRCVEKIKEIQQQQRKRK